MTNKQNQATRNREKWIRSQQLGEDLSGKMSWCTKCQKRTDRNTCEAPQAERDENCLCAKAYNRMKRG